MARTDADRKARLLESLVGLRKVQNRVVGDDDVKFAIEVLEEELGEAVPQRTAAKAIGVSSVEVAKLISARKLETVVNASGKADVSLAALLDYIESKARESADAGGAMSSSAANAEDFEAKSIAKDIKHISEMRALAFHRALVRNLDRKMIDEARERLAERRENGTIDEAIAEQWTEILEKNVSDVGAVMTEYSERGRELRQSSPFDRRSAK